MPRSKKLLYSSHLPAGWRNVEVIRTARSNISLKTKIGRDEDRTDREKKFMKKEITLFVLEVCSSNS